MPDREPGRSRSAPPLSRPRPFTAVLSLTGPLSPPPSIYLSSQCLARGRPPRFGPWLSRVPLLCRCVGAGAGGLADGASRGRAEAGRGPRLASSLLLCSARPNLGCFWAFGSRGGRGWWTTAPSGSRLKYGSRARAVPTRLRLRLRPSPPPTAERSGAGRGTAGRGEAGRPE